MTQAKELGPNERTQLKQKLKREARRLGVRAFRNF